MTMYMYLPPLDEELPKKIYIGKCSNFKDELFRLFLHWKKFVPKNIIKKFKADLMVIICWPPRISKLVLVYNVSVWCFSDRLWGSSIGARTCSSHRCLFFLSLLISPRFFNFVHAPENNTSICIAHCFYIS